MKTRFPEPVQIETNGVSLETFTAGPEDGKPIAHATTMVRGRFAALASDSVIAYLHSVR